MKKIGLWMAALTAVTVGGVYATWSYAENNNIAKVIQEKSIALAPAHNAGESGSYSVVTSSDFGMWIESSGYMATNEYKFYPEFVMTGSITIYFTPSANASDTIKGSGLETEFDFSLNLGGAAAWKYDPQLVEDNNASDDVTFVKNVTPHKTTIYPTATDGQTNCWTYDAANKRFYYTIDSNITRTVNPTDNTYTYSTPEGKTKQYQDIITFVDGLKLDTYAKYEYFRDVALDGKMVVLTINDTTGAAEATQGK